MSSNFDQWLEDELEKGFAAVSSRPVPSEPRYRALAGRNTLSVALSHVASSKGLASVLAAGAIMAGGSAAALAATGTNPLVFAQQVPATVQQVPAAVVSCKDQLSSGQHGVGECVSQFVQANRPASPKSGVSSEPTSPARAAGAPASAPGAAVSTVARSTAPGPEHREAVSTAARSNAQTSASASGSGSRNERDGNPNAPGQDVAAAARDGSAREEDPSPNSPRSAGQSSPSTGVPDTRGNQDDSNAASSRGAAAPARGGRANGDDRGQATSSAGRPNDTASPSPTPDPTPVVSVTPTPSRPGNSVAAPGRGRRDPGND